MQDIETGYADFQNKHQYNERLMFIRKVYGILSAQLLFTVLFNIIPMTSSAFRDWMFNNFWLAIVFGFLYLSTAITLICCSDFAKKVPQNYIFLGIFTLSLSYLMAFITSTTDPMTVFIAMVMTFGVTATVTAYAFFTKTDFTTLYGIMFGVLIGAIIFGIFMGMFYHSKAMNLVFCLIFIIIYTVYIVIDTQAIAGGRRYSVSTEDYILGALMLYVDIIMLFIYLLRFLRN